MTRPALRVLTDADVAATQRPLTHAVEVLAPRRALRAVACSVPGCTCPRVEFDRTCDLHRRHLEEPAA